MLFSHITSVPIYTLASVELTIVQSLSLDAQQSATLKYTVTVPKEASGDLTVDQTPLGNVSLQQ